jgi:hypothetical protein
MWKLFVIVLVAVTMSANETSYRSLQSGSPTGPTPLHDRGLYGQGQIIAVLDTGAEYHSCYLAEPDGSHPPMNTGSPGGGLDWQNIDYSRRKVIAYNFLYSCDQYPGAPGCDVPGAPGSLDNHRHGTYAASVAAGDRGAPLHHDYADSVAPGAKLVVQDAGYIGPDDCTQLPGVGCPAKLTPIFEQAYRQGARIHSNSWGDRQGNLFFPPTANYPQSARDVDAFVWSHPDMLVIFNTGNLGSQIETPLSSLSAPGSAKNTLQIGGTRSGSRDDDVIASFTLFGPARDGRIKPDLVGPARVVAGDVDLDGNPETCDVSSQPGTSWASPSVAGAAALVRQYYIDGFYPSGVANPAHSRVPSAALMKATLIAAARPARLRHDIMTNYLVPALPAPSHEQGWGFPILDNALFFAGDERQMRVEDVRLASGLTAGETRTQRISVRAGTPLRIVLVWTDPPGVVRSPSDTTPQLVNDLDLRVVTGDATHFGNGPSPDRLNNVEVVSLDDPEAGMYTISVSAERLGLGPRQSYALMITGDFVAVPGRVRAVGR